MCRLICSLRIRIGGALRAPRSGLLLSKTPGPSAEEDEEFARPGFGNSYSVDPFLEGVRLEHLDEPALALDQTLPLILAEPLVDAFTRGADHAGELVLGQAASDHDGARAVGLADA